MWLKIFLLIVWLAILVFNVAYKIFPESLQDQDGLRKFSIITAFLILAVGIGKEINSFRSQRWAHISVDGNIIQKFNFPWIITKTTDSSGKIVYIVNERYGDASEVSIKQKGKAKYQIYNAIDGVGIKFLSSENEIKDFWVTIKTR